VCLNRFGIVHAVLTDDGDALVFGATHIIRRLSYLMAQQLSFLNLLLSVLT